MGSANPIRNVSDTARWVAIYRAMESERPDALFHDPFARRLGGARGEAIAKAMGGKSSSWPLVVRTVVMDDIVRRCVAQGARTVLNLAAGLDTRPYRLDLPEDLLWLHVDLPEMLDYFRESMQVEQPRCKLEFIAADLRDSEVRRSVMTQAVGNGPLLVITEGLLLYLEAEDVTALSRDLHDVARARWWLTDLASPMLLKYLERRWQGKLAAGNAPFRFGPADGTAFFAPQGWRELEFHSTLADAWRLDRKMPFAWLGRILSRLQPKSKRKQLMRMSGTALLASSGADAPAAAPGDDDHG